MRIFILFLVVSNYSFGCEVCGCAASTSSIGAIGQSPYQVLGMNFQGRYFKSEHPPLFGGPIERSKETFHTINLAGKYQLGKRVQIFGSIPFHFNTQTKEDTTITHNGIGDVRISGRYALISRNDSIKQSSFQLQIGAGIKLPTGNYSNDAHSTSNVYTGTGSWDFPMDLNLYWSLNDKWSIQSENTFVLKTENRVGYQFGNAMQGSVYAMRSWKLGGVRLSPGLGIQFDHLFQDEIHGDDGSTFGGGDMSTLTVGTNVEIRNFFVNLRYFHPIAQDLSKGYTTMQGQFSVGLFYFLKDKKRL